MLYVCHDTASDCLQASLYEELAAIANSAFRFYTKTGPFQVCPHLASELHKYAPEHTLTGARLFRDFQPEAITALLNRCLRCSCWCNAARGVLSLVNVDAVVAVVLCRLTPDNMRLAVVSKLVEDKCTLAETWYGTKYFLEPIDAVTTIIQCRFSCDHAVCCLRFAAYCFAV